jgi:ribonucleoside-diphosphate reductase alpha chain
MFRRVAKAIASAEKKFGVSENEITLLEEKFYQSMIDGIFLPNSPTLMNAGRKNGMLSACFVVPVYDSINDIFDAIKIIALIQKAGGGTGFDFSPLRPTGDLVASSGGQTSGPISFMKVFSEATNAIQQGAFRRGANMGMMSIEHPDILKFIYAKKNPGTFTNFNLSVKVPDSFMDQLDNNHSAYHIVTNPRTQKRYVIPQSVNIENYSINDLLPEDNENNDCYTVEEIWNIIIENAHATGEPGICFIDRINEDNPTPHIGTIEATNPCGEQPLLPYEACTLGSINVSKFVDKNKKDINWKSLAETVKLAVRFLDNTIDVNHYPVPEVKEITLANRKTGLGIMGFADLLILLGVRYDSEEAVNIASKLSSFIQEHAHKASEELAKERGCFPNHKNSLWDTRHNRQMRNAALTTIAPTGSISIIAGCSSGIEPVFSFAYKRRALDGNEFIQIHPLLEKLGTEQGWLDEKVKTELLKGKRPCDIPEIPEELADILVTAHDVLPDHHIDIQAAFQENVDNAVSKTINLPRNTPVDVIDKIFRYAHEKKCKGITFYGDNSREGQVISKAEKKREVKSNLKPRVRTTTGSTTKFRMGCGTLFVTVNKDDDGLCEVFANLGKAGGCPAQSEATCRAISAALRCGVKPEILIEQLRNIRCPATITRRKDNKDIDVLSCPDAIARAIEEALGEYMPAIKNNAKKCPDCGQPLRFEAGCDICSSCGFSKCG